MINLVPRRERTLVRILDAERPGRTRRSRRALSAVAATAAVLAGTVLGAPTAAAAPADCPWLDEARRVLDGVRNSTDERRPQLIPALERAIATCTDGGTGAGAGDRPYFQKADWLWDPIPADPVLDPNSDGMVQDLATDVNGYIANIGEYGVTLVEPGAITPSTPRFTIKPSEYGPVLSDVPIPEGTEMASGDDKHLAVADPQSGKVYNFWQAQESGDGWTASGSAPTDLNGDGRETDGGTSTGSNLARYAGVVRIDEIEKGLIPHALFFSTNMATKEDEGCRYPAAKSDGKNMTGVANPIPEGGRIQLDPSVDVDSLDASPGVKTVARALQTYGAYVGDNGGARVAILFEHGPDSQVYEESGIGNGDYGSLAGIPWDKMRVLKAWNGTDDPGFECSGAS